MKNWKYIEGAKTGNESIASHPESLVAQEIYKIYMDAGKDENKALEALSTKYKNLPKEALKKHLKDAIKAYDTMIKNSKTGNAGITDKEFNSENDLRRWCIEHNYTYTPVGGGYYRLEDDSGKNRRDLEAHVKAGNKKVGNETLHEYAASKPRVINDDKTGAEGFFKKLSDDVKEREKKDDKEIKLVGNETYQHKLYPNKYVIIEGKNYKIITDGKVEKSGVLTDAVLYGINQTYKRVENKTGNKKLKFTDKQDGLKEFVYDEENDKGYIYYDGKLVDTIPHAGQGWLNLIKQKAFSSGVMNKVGNSTVSEYNAEIQRLTKKAEQLRRMGQGRQAMEVEKQIEKLGKELSEIGNSAPDDKFAYVMREFDEGKLKTPDGKVVTDPAQAKAIAYSESKKTENGLARARNAMAGNWNSDRNINPVGTYKEFIANLKNAIELGVAAVTYNIDSSTLKTWVEQAKKEGYGSHISGIQGQKVILK